MSTPPAHEHGSDRTGTPVGVDVEQMAQRIARKKITEKSEVEFEGEFIKISPIKAVKMEEAFEVDTLEGTMKGKAGDWLAEGIEGERWPIDADIFDKTYKPKGKTAGTTWTAATPTFSAPFPGRNKAAAQKAFTELVGAATFSGAENLLRRAASQLAKDFPGYKFTAEIKGLWGGDIGYIGWDGRVQGGHQQVLSLRIVSPVKVNPAKKGWATPDYVIPWPDFEVGVSRSPGAPAYPALGKNKDRLPTMRDVAEVLNQYGRDKLLMQLGGPLEGTHKGVVTLAQVKDFIRRQRTYFDLEDATPTRLYYSTRDEGDVGGGEPGAGDILEARRLRDLILKEFGAGQVQVQVDGVDEWVSFEVTLGTGKQAAQHQVEIQGSGKRWDVLLDGAPVVHTLSKKTAEMWAAKFRAGDFSSLPTYLRPKEAAQVGTVELGIHPTFEAEVNMAKGLITESLTGVLASRVADRWEKGARNKTAAVDGKTTGNRAKVALVIPVPSELAEMFPSLGNEDKSPSHVTLLYVGAIPPNREEEFLDVLASVLNKEPGPVRAWFDGVDKFVHPSHGREVFYSPVRFSRDMGTVRDRLTAELKHAGFEVKNSFPLAYTPHTTLAYVEGFDQMYIGEVPQGAWEFSSVQVWGMPTVHEVELGEYERGYPTFVERQEAGLLSTWGDLLE
jgi:2'-5' RNA ligase